MGSLVDRERLESLLRALGELAREPTRVYLVGGAVALLRGWRATTVDVDLRLEPDSSPLLRSFPALKRELGVNLELASPLDFLPELPGWRERSPFVRQEGRVAIFEFDPYSQALAKVERGHAQDLIDVEHLFGERLVEAGKLTELFERIAPELYRFPAVDEEVLRAALAAAVTEFAPGD